MKFGFFMKFLTPLCRACSRGRDHGRGQKNAGETISFTLLTLTSFSCTALLFFQLAPMYYSTPMKNDESSHNYAKGCQIDKYSSSLTSIRLFTSRIDYINSFNVPGVFLLRICLDRYLSTFQFLCQQIDSAIYVFSSV